MSGTLPCRADTQCRPRFGDIWRCRRHVADMSPTCGAKVFPTRLGWCQSHGARRMGLSTQRETCQVNKRAKYSYGKLPPKLVLSIPWEALCVDLIGPYTIKGKNGSVIEFMCLTMIDPVTGWFEIVELPVASSRDSSCWH